eukprot:scaffold631440_cov46-Prasinocladus_malaysianus.AAC.1
MCETVIPTVLITEDASVDARFSHNPYVAGDPFIKFYAGAPLLQSSNWKVPKCVGLPRRWSPLRHPLCRRFEAPGLHSRDVSSADQLCRDCYSGA